jgi:hypothetical protein
MGLLEAILGEVLFEFLQHSKWLAALILVIVGIAIVVEIDHPASWAGLLLIALGLFIVWPRRLQSDADEN